MQKPNNLPKPTKKSKGIEDFITSIAGKSRQDAYDLGECMTCDRGIRGFRDALSTKEYSSSGMCQQCQDKVFRG